MYVGALLWSQVVESKIYGTILPFPHCFIIFNEEKKLRDHLRAAHILTDAVVDHILEKLSTQWAYLVDITLHINEAEIVGNPIFSKDAGPDSEVIGLPWKVWSPQSSRAVMAAWVLGGRSICPHPCCIQRFSSPKEVTDHWQAHHLATESVTMYSCRHGEGTRFPCKAVCNSKKGLIKHCRIDQGYTDWVVEQMLKKIEADASGTERVKVARNVVVSSSKASGAAVQPSPTVPKPKATPLLKAMIAPEPQMPATENKSPDRPAIYQCQHGMGTFDPCNESFRTQTALVRHARNDHGYSDFVAQAMLRNSIVHTKRHPDKSRTSHANRSQALSGTVTVVSAASRSPSSSTSSPAMTSSSPSSSPANADTSSMYGKSLSLLFAAGGNKDSQELPTILWKAIISAWKSDKKCPHPKCAVQHRTFMKYSHMLGHWLRVHMDNSQMQGRFYPCLHGQDTEKLCVEVFGSSDKLTSHLLIKHGYKKEEIQSVLTNLKTEWDKMELEEATQDLANALAGKNSCQNNLENDSSTNGSPTAKKQKLHEEEVIVLD